MILEIVVALTGASGIIYGIRLLEVLKTISYVKTHLIVSSSAKKVLCLETDYNLHQLNNLTDVVYNNKDVSSCISSGSCFNSGMIILPCSIKTLSGVVNSYGDSLISRAADVALKEKRKLILGVRETPLHLGHLKLMINASRMGALIFPLMPAFYHKPRSINELIDQTVNRIIDQFGIKLKEDLFKRWDGK